MEYGGTLIPLLATNILMAEGWRNRGGSIIYIRAENYNSKNHNSKLVDTITNDR